MLQNLLGSRSKEQRLLTKLGSVDSNMAMAGNWEIGWSCVGRRKGEKGRKM